MTPMCPQAPSSKAFGGNYLNRETISLFAQSDDLHGNPFAVLKRQNTEGARICFIEPFGSEVSLCVFGRELASCKFPVEQMLGFRRKSALRPELEEFMVAKARVVSLESTWVRHECA